MISGDSTASHMGNVKNIEKARERRTFETMPGSSETGIPDDLLQHAETVHPRMGYDMSDSIFMQEMQTAARQKESKKALEERSALEAFRAASIQKHFERSAPAASIGGESKSGRDGEGIVDVGDDRGNKKGACLPTPTPPRPIAGIRIRKKRKQSPKNQQQAGGKTPPSLTPSLTSVPLLREGSIEQGDDGRGMPTKDDRETTMSTATATTADKTSGRNGGAADEVGDGNENRDESGGGEGGRKKRNNGFAKGKEKKKKVLGGKPPSPGSSGGATAGSGDVTFSVGEAAVAGDDRSRLAAAAAAENPSGPRKKGDALGFGLVAAYSSGEDS